MAASVKDALWATPKSISELRKIKEITTGVQELSPSSKTICPSTDPPTPSTKTTTQPLRKRLRIFPIGCLNTSHRLESPHRVWFLMISQQTPLSLIIKECPLAGGCLPEWTSLP